MRAAQLLVGLAGLLLAPAVQAYVPASPSNDTSSLVAADDFIQINWLPQGTSAYKDALSRQLANTNSQPVAGYRGALVNFQDLNATASTGTPWIALISCDDGSQYGRAPAGYSQLDSISLAVRAGAETAILYSIYAETCVLQNNFALVANGSIDLYVTASRQSALAITSQFTNVVPQAYWFNATALSASNDVVTRQISNLGGAPSTTSTPSLFGPSTSSGAASASPTGAVDVPAGTFSYLIATVANSHTNSSNAPIVTQQQNTGGGGANTGLAMIILYAITGCVTLLFLIVIMSGAIRAMRHPERYGPRARTSRAGDNGRTRIGGMSQAILDTFPVVKFFSGQRDGNTAAAAAAPRQSEEADSVTKDLETGEGAVAHDEIAVRSADGFTEVPMHVLANGRGSTSSDTVGGAASAAARQQDTSASGMAIAGAPTGAVAGTASAAAATTAGRPSTESNAHQETVAPVDTDPNAVDDSQTCPICLLDFEDGDDIRILPCDSRHRFHDACVVPWLLNVSSLCPLCRLDLAKDREAPEGTEEAQAAEDTPAETSAARPAARPRASSVLATSFRQLLPSSTNPSRLSRQGNASDTTAPAASVPETAESVSTTAVPGDAQNQPTRSRFMRYVEQRRQRVRPMRSSTRRETASAPTAPDAA